MFQFENAEYQRLLEQTRGRGKRHIEDSKRRLADLQEFLQDLTIREVDFVLALRKCDYVFRLELYQALSLWCNNRIRFYRKLACVMESKHLAEELTRE